MANAGKNKKLATFNVEPEVWQAFQAKARENGYSAAALLKEWIGAYLDDEGKQPTAQPATEQTYLESAAETYLDDSQLQRIVEALTPRVIDKLAPQVTAAVESRLPDSIDMYLDKNLGSHIGKLEGDRLGESERLGEIESLRQQLEEAGEREEKLQSDIHELRRLWDKSRAELAEARSQNAELEAQAERRKLAEDSWPWQCWAVREQDNKKEERLIASAPTRKEVEKQGGDFFVSSDTSVYPYEMGWRIEYRQDSEAYVLRHQLARTEEERKRLFARVEETQREARIAKGTREQYLIALYNIEPKLAEKALSTLNVGKRSALWRDARKAIGEFSRLLREWVEENAQNSLP